MIDNRTGDEFDPATTDPAKPKQRNQNAQAGAAEDDELWDAQKVLEYFGGGSSAPISIATLYRNIGKIYPRPINVSPNVVRWIPSECRAARRAMIDARNQPKPAKSGKPRGRKRGTTAAGAEAT